MRGRHLKFWLSALTVVTALMLAAVPQASARSNFIGVVDPRDMVYDSHSKILFITSGSSVVRYSLKSRKFLSAINLGGTLNGIDLSPDGTTLAVADKTVLSLNLIDLKTLKFIKIPLGAGLDEQGLYDVAWGSDQMVYATATFPGSGGTGLRKVDPVTGDATVIGGVTNFTALRPSTDRNVIGIAVGDISDGSWGAIYVQTGNVVIRDGYSNGTSWFNYDIAVANDGSQFSIPTYGGLFVYDDTYTKIWTLGQYAVQVFDGVAYSPRDGNLYATEANTDQIDVF